MGKSGEEFIKFVERQQEESGNDATRAFYEDMERQYYEAQEEKARMNTEEYKQQREEMRKALWGAFNHFHPHTWNYGRE
jgi:hypothetical protein